MDNSKFGVIVVLLVGLIGVVAYVGLGNKVIVDQPPPPPPPPPRFCQSCMNDEASHIHMNWTNESSSFWTVTVEHHPGEKKSQRIPPTEGRQIDGILVGMRETIVERENGERWVGICRAEAGFNHSMRINDEGIWMYMTMGGEAMWLPCDWLTVQ